MKKKKRKLKKELKIYFKNKNIYDILFTKEVIRMNDIINLLVNNGLGVVCVAYLLYFQSTTMKDLTENQEKTNLLLESMTNRLEQLEEKIDKKG